jgi:hypothetical protein
MTAAREMDRGAPEHPEDESERRRYYRLTQAAPR